MQETTLDRRLKLLKLEGNGLLPSEIVKELSAEFQVTPRTVWYDFASKQKWQPKLVAMEKALLKTLNRHDQLYRKVMLAYLQAGDDKTKLVALNLLRGINKDQFDMMQSSGKIEKAPDKAEITAKTTTTIIWKAWKPEDESTT